MQLADVLILIYCIVFVLPDYVKNVNVFFFFLRIIPEFKVNKFNRLNLMTECLIDSFTN